MARRLYLNAKERWVAAGYPDYAPWVPLLFHSITLSAAVAAVAQRSGDGYVAEAAALAGLTLLPYVVCEAINPRMVPWYLFAPTSLAAISVLMWQYPVDLDFGVIVAGMIVGRFGALESMRRSGLICAMAIVGVALTATGGFDGAAYAITVVIVSWDIGWILQMQQRRIDQQQKDQAGRLLKATLEERQRIAREVHDVVAHSLSVTLLHLTAARRDLEDGGDTGEAIAALKDAEQIGRQAMTDIRATVGLLNEESGTRTSTPDLADVPALVQQFRSAGLDVDYETAGDDSTLTAAARTGLYRIVQESLANIAKHEPHASATVTLDLATDPARLAVRNTLTHAVGNPNGGSGLRGMSERASHLGASFSAGPVGNGWQVLVELKNPHAHTCPLPKLGRTPETA
ncbi:MAG TPA: histidine kinase [Nocardioidaceae bacterium]|nr:histidine kinase [Nocardioidaceae bacterium]